MGAVGVVCGITIQRLLNPLSNDGFSAVGDLHSTFKNFVGYIYYATTIRL